MVPVKVSPAPISSGKLTLILLPLGRVMVSVLRPGELVNMYLIGILKVGPGLGAGCGGSGVVGPGIVAELFTPPEAGSMTIIVLVPFRSTLSIVFPVSWPLPS